MHKKTEYRRIKFGKQEIKKDKDMKKRHNCYLSSILRVVFSND